MMAKAQAQVVEIWLTPEQVMQRLQISKSKFYLETSLGDLPHFKIRKMIRVRESDLLAWMESKRV